MGCGSSAAIDPCEICMQTQGKLKCALFCCLNCGLALCEACSNGHQADVLQNKFQRPHRVVPLTEHKRGIHDEYINERRQRGCPNHVTELKETYCVEHEMSTCRDCNTESHSRCTVKNLEELRKEWTAEINRKMRKLKFACEKLDQKHSLLETSLNRVPQQRTNLTDELQDQIDELLNLIEMAKVSRKKKIDEVMDEQKMELEILLQQVDEQRAEMRKEFNNHSQRLKNKDMKTLQTERALFKKQAAAPALLQDNVVRALADVSLQQPLLNEESLNSIIGSVEVMTPKTANIAVLMVQAYPPTTAGSVASRTPYTATSRRSTQAALVDVDV